MLASMANQQRCPDEIWLIDDDSTDPATQAFLAKLGKDYQGIPLHVVRQPFNQGAGAARNVALRDTTCDLVAFCDADDAWLPEHLAQSLAALQADAGLQLVASNFYAVAPDGTATLWDCAAISARRDALNPKGNPQVQYYYRGFLGILTVVARRDFLVRGGGFRADRRYSLDWECWHAALAATPGSRFAVLPLVGARYTLAPDGLTSRTWPRLSEREGYLPYFARAVSLAGPVWWPLLLLRGWLTIQYETLGPLWRRRDYPKLVWLGLRAPWVLGRLLLASHRPPQRQNYLTR